MVRVVARSLCMTMLDPFALGFAIQLPLTRALPLDVPTKREYAALLEISHALVLHSKLPADRLSALSLASADSETQTQHALLGLRQLRDHLVEFCLPLGLGRGKKWIVYPIVNQLVDGHFNEKDPIVRPFAFDAPQPPCHPCGCEAGKIRAIVRDENIDRARQSQHPLLNHLS